MPNQITEIEVEFVSLVDKGANKKKFLIQKNENKVIFNASFIKGSEKEQQIVTGIVYEPNEIDAHDEYMTAETIEKAAYTFLSKYRKIDTQHDFNLTNNEIVESWVAKNDENISGQSVKKGTWLMSVKINDNQTWSKIKNGDITGFSLAGVGTVIQKGEEKMKKENQNEELREEIEEMKAKIKSLEDEKDAELKKNLQKQVDNIEKMLKKQEDEKEEEEKKNKEESKKTEEEKTKETEDLKKAIQKIDDTIKKMSVNGVAEENKIDLNATLRKAIIKKYGDTVNISEDKKELITKAATAPTDVAAVIPRPIDTDMVKILGEFSPLFGMSSRVQFTGNEITLPVKKKLANSVKSADIGQGVAGSGVQFDYIVIGKGVLQSEFLLHDELLADTQIDLMKEVNETIIEDFAEEIAERLLRGVLNPNLYQGNKFEGIEKNTDFMNSTTGRVVNQANPNEYVWSELVKLPFKLQHGLRVNAAYFVSPGAHLALQTMKDTTGQPIWRPSLVAGAPATFNGYPIYEVWNMGRAAGEIDILFANMDKFYKIGYDFEMKMELDRKPSERGTNIVTNSRLGGRVRDPDAAYAILKV